MNQWECWECWAIFIGDNLLTPTIRKSVTKCVEAYKATRDIEPNLPENVEPTKIIIMKKL